MTGRPRSEAADRAILAATVTLLARDGYQSLRVSDVATTAGVGKPTLYRRYASKADLVAAAIVALSAGQQPEPDLPAATRPALLSLLRSTAQALATPGGMTILGSLLTQEQRDPELIAAFRTRVFEPRHGVVAGVLRRGIAAGELDPGTPVPIVIDVLFGALLARAVLGEPVTEPWLVGVVEVAMRGTDAGAARRPARRVPAALEATVGGGNRRNRLSLRVPRTHVSAQTCRRDPLNSRPPVKPALANEPFKHVIDEYKHQAQTITCTCGWHGSSQAIDRGGSEWTAHLIEVRGKKR